MERIIRMSTDFLAGGFIVPYSSGRGNRTRITRILRILTDVWLAPNERIIRLPPNARIARTCRREHLKRVEDPDIRRIVWGP